MNTKTDKKISIRSLKNQTIDSTFETETKKKTEEIDD